MGFLTLMMNPVRLGFWQAALSVLVSGGCAILYALAAVQRRFYLFAVIGVLEAFVFGALGNVYANNELLISPHSPLRGQLLKLGLGGVLTLVAGYALFVAFFQREGARYFKAHTEIALAQEIHRALVPKIERTIGQFSIYGASLPSGEVGGDLVDVVVRPESPANGAIWTAYIADVSGHGVSAGVLMAMFKTAVRTSVMAHNSSDALLNEVHRALYPLKTPNMFVTAGVLHCDASAKLTLSLAGHPPLLHFRNATGEVIEYAAEDLPLGILPEQTFQTREVPVGQGDVFALLTDGMTEVFDSHRNELGLEPVKAALRSHAARPLPELFGATRDVALRFGKQDDDQTLLLIRAD